jgi:hypothetical protein
MQSHLWQGRCQCDPMISSQCIMLPRHLSYVGLGSDLLISICLWYSMKKWCKRYVPHACTRTDTAAIAVCDCEYWSFPLLAFGFAWTWDSKVAWKNVAFAQEEESSTLNQVKKCGESWISFLQLYHHVRFFRFSFYTTKKMAPDSVLLLRRHRGRPIKEIYGDNHVPWLSNKFPPKVGKTSKLLSLFWKDGIFFFSQTPRKTSQDLTLPKSICKIATIFRVSPIQPLEIWLSPSCHSGKNNIEVVLQMTRCTSPTTRPDL